MDFFDFQWISLIFDGFLGFSMDFYDFPWISWILQSWGGGTGKEASVRLQGGFREASGRQRRAGGSRLRSTSYYESKF